MSKLRYFSLSEFSCKCCHSGKEVMQWAFLFKLDSMRHEVGRPFVVNSGFRCESHNRVEGGKADSSHLVGLAVDILVPDSNFRFRIMEEAKRYGINRIGVGKNFIHLDVDKSKPKNVYWVY